MNTNNDNTRWLSRGVLLLAVMLTGCEEFDPRTTLSGYRMIGIEASPPEVGPGDSVDLTVHDFYDGGESITYEWSVCLHSLGVAVDYACSDAELEHAVDASADAKSITLDLGADGVDLRAALDALGPVPAANGEIRTLKDGIDVWVKLTSGPRCDGCESITTVKRLVVREAQDEPSNENPVIEEFEVIGARRKGETVTLRVDTAQAEMYLDPLTGEQRSEELVYTWYTSDGETDPGLTYGETRETELKLPKEGGPIELVVAVRDGRGGLAVDRRTIDVE